MAILSVHNEWVCTVCVCLCVVYIYSLFVLCRCDICTFLYLACVYRSHVEILLFLGFVRVVGDLYVRICFLLSL